MSRGGLGVLAQPKGAAGDAGALAWTPEPGGMLLIDWSPGLDPVIHLLPVAAAPVQRYAG